MTIEEQNRRAKQGLVKGLKPDYPYNSGVVLSLDGSVFRAGSKHHIWVQPVGVDASPVVVFSQNPLTSVQAGWEVIYQQSPEPPEVWQLIRFNKAVYAQQTAELGNFPDPSLPLHAQEHTINRDYVGNDPLMVYGRMIARFNVQPTNPASLKLMVLPGSYAGSTYHQFITSIRLTSSLSANVPSTSNMARLVGISQDYSGTLIYTNGSEFSKSEETPPAVAYPDIPAEDELLAMIYLEQGDTTITNSAFRYDQRNIGNGGGRQRVAKMYTPDLSTVAAQTDSAENVAIGDTIVTDNGYGKLQVYGEGGTSDAPNLKFTTTDDDYPTMHMNNDAHDNMAICFDAYWNGAWRSSDVGSNFRLQKLDDRFQINYNAGTAQGSEITSWEAGFFLLSDGKAGIGTNDPLKLFHVNEGAGSTAPFQSYEGLYVSIEGIAQMTVRNVTDSIEAGIFSHSDGNAYIGAWTNHAVKFVTNNADRMRIDNSGDVSIGTNTASAQLHVDQSSATGAKPVLHLDQADISEEMISFETTIGTGNAIEAVGAKTLTTTHFIKVTLPGGLTRYIPAGTIA